MTALPAPDRRLTERRISPALGEFAILEYARLREELLQCRSKLALAAESAAGSDELIAELLTACNQASFCLRELLPLDSDAQLTVRLLAAAISHATQPRPDQS